MHTPGIPGNQHVFAALDFGGAVWSAPLLEMKIAGT
jgi:hypothetical protein